MTGWEIVGIICIALPFVCILGAVALDDPWVFFATLLILAAIMTPIVVGSLLLTGEWSP